RTTTTEFFGALDAPGGSVRSTRPQHRIQNKSMITCLNWFVLLVNADGRGNFQAAKLTPVQILGHLHLYRKTPDGKWSTQMSGSPQGNADSFQPTGKRREGWPASVCD